MRATRAYLAGFGTSGSLLAGAALMFVLASAVVGFHGWPQVGGQSAVTNVAAPRLTLPPSTRTSRILAALSTRGVTGGAGGGATGVAANRGTPGAAAGGGNGSVAGSGPSGTGTSQPITASACGVGACTPVASPSSSHPATLAGKVSQAVAGAGAGVSSGVSSTSNAAANAVAPVSPQVAKALKKAGHTTGQSVTTATSTAAGVVSQLGNAVSGVTHHLGLTH